VVQEATLNAAAKWIQRGVAIFVALFSFAVFLPVGGFFYIFLLTRATISLTLASFLSAMTNKPLTFNVQHLLHQSVSFFPAGLSIIWEAAQLIWNGENVASSEPKFDSIALLTNIILALIFFILVMIFLEAVGLPGVRVPAILAWFFGTPILLLIFIGFTVIVSFIMWPILKDSWRQLSSGTIRSSPPPNDQARRAE
jgi:hypothetical protein